MLKATRTLTLIGAMALVALGCGFAAFVTTVQTGIPASAGRTDGIVVLTGSKDRIVRGLELIANGQARRLLISGVDRSNHSIDSLLRGAGIGSAVACCIDLGYAATNTAGNANEARDWARAWGFRRLLVVTSQYHMPRSMMEFTEAMPGIELIAHPVPTRYVRLDAWWHDGAAARLLASEYLKLLVAKARLGLLRILAAVWPSSIARTNSGVPQVL